MSKLLDQIKRAHSARSIEAKDFSLSELFTGDVDAVTLKVTGFASKLVDKYVSENNKGYHTMIYLLDGKKTGAFSNALHEFAAFFYENVGLDVNDTFNKVMFPNGHLEVLVSVVQLDKKKSTYNFEILDGEIKGFTKQGRVEINQSLLIEDTEPLALPETVIDAASENLPVPEPETEETPTKKKK